jgi:hypothetical protein
MPRVKIEDIKPPTKELDLKEMKKLYGGNTGGGGTTTSPEKLKLMVESKIF